MPMDIGPFAIGKPACRAALEKLDAAVAEVRDDGAVMAALHGFRDRARLPNPAIRFTKDAKAGRYDVLADESYLRLLRMTEAAARHWHDQVEIELLPEDVAALEDAMREVSQLAHKILSAAEARDAARDLFDATEQVMALNRGTGEPGEWTDGRFADGVLTPRMLADPDTGRGNHAWDGPVIRACKACGADLAADASTFSVRDGNLYSADGETLYIGKASPADREPAVTDGFYRFLAGRDSWDFAGGAFEKAMAGIFAELPS